MAGVGFLHLRPDLPHAPATYSSNVGESICDLRIHSPGLNLRHCLGQHSPYVSRRLRRGNMFRRLLVGVLAPPAPVAPQLRSFIGFAWK